MKHSDNPKALSNELKFFATKVIIGTTLTLWTSVFFYIFYKSSVIFLSALIGLGIATLVSPLLDKMKKRWSIPRFAGAFFILVLGCLMFVGVFVLAGSVLTEQFDSFRSKIPELITFWQNKWSLFSTEHPRISKIISQQSPEGLTDDLMGYASSVFHGLADAATGISLAFVIALFTSANSKLYSFGWHKYCPPHYRKPIGKAGQLSAHVLRKWFMAQLLDMLIVGVLTTFGLWFVGIKFWALFGLLAGLLSILPFIGLFIVIVLSLVVVAVLQPEKLILLGVVFLITQQLEGNFILPKLMKDYVSIPPAPLVFLMLLVGVWLGTLGILVTTPLFAIALAIYKEFGPRY